MKTIALCGGGTAGHVMPLVALLPHLKQRFKSIIYFSSGKEIEKKLMQVDDVRIFTVPTPALKRSITPQNLLIPIKLLRAVRECAAILKINKVDVVFSKGGYCALPVCLAAAKLGIPYVCHESDLSMGLANKLTYKKSARLLTVFDQTAQKYGGVCVGPPIREDLNAVPRERARKALGIKKSKKPLLLVTGGSQGSKTINAAIDVSLNELLKTFDILHLRGKGNMPAYKSIIGYYPCEFAQMSNCLSACDIVLTRGGSNTLFEIAYCKKPSLIVPLKKGSRGDQVKNAEYFCSKKVSETCDEDVLPKNATRLLVELWQNRDKYIKNLNRLNVTSGTKATAEEIFSIYDGVAKKP